MIIGLGSDVIDIRRIERTLERHRERFLERVFTPVEIAKAERRAERIRAATYAKRFAAKEAASKALGTGFSAGVFWRDLGFPLVPYGKGGLVYTAWWVTKGSGVEFVDGDRAAGGKWGYTGVAGISLLLDFFDSRLARDFDTGLGVNHSYLFAEYTYASVNNFGGSGLDLWGIVTHIALAEEL